MSAATRHTLTCKRADLREVRHVAENVLLLQGYADVRLFAVIEPADGAPSPRVEVLLSPGLFHKNDMHSFHFDWPADLPYKGTGIARARQTGFARAW